MTHNPCYSVLHSGRFFLVPVDEGAQRHWNACGHFGATTSTTAGSMRS